MDAVSGKLFPFCIRHCSHCHCIISIVFDDKKSVVCSTIFAFKNTRNLTNPVVGLSEFFDICLALSRMEAMDGCVTGAGVENVFYICF